MRALLSLALLAMVLTSCAPQIQAPTFLAPALTNYKDIPGWSNDDHAAAYNTLLYSCEKILAKKADESYGKGILQASAREWQHVCRQTGIYGPMRAEAFFRNEFTPFYAHKDAEKNGLFTGYYVPLLQGSRTRTGEFQTPVYRLPPDVKKGQGYFTRTQIEAGALNGRGLEILWVNDPVMLFFAHVQGSTRVQLRDGSVVRVGFAGKNNREYIAIGKVLKDRGEMDEVDFFSLRQWLYDYPEKAVEVMQTNPSYVFFVEQKDEGGPIGAQGVALTDERSLAVDDDYIPYGMPLFLLSDLPEPYEQRYERLLIAQDTGGAIKGPVRGDVYFGSSDRAEQLAGRMKQRGTYILLVPNSFAYRLR